MKSFFLLLCFALTSVAGCHSSKNMAELTKAKWVLETLDGEKVMLSDSSNKMFIQFEENEKRINGRAACNRFFGNYEMDGSKLKFSPMGATRMACPDLQKENVFFQMLEKVDAYSLKDNTLAFLSKGKVVATFRKSDESNKE